MKSHQITSNDVDNFGCALLNVRQMYLMHIDHDVYDWNVGYTQESLEPLLATVFHWCCQQQWDGGLGNLMIEGTMEIEVEQGNTF